MPHSLDSVINVTQTHARTHARTHTHTHTHTHNRFMVLLDFVQDYMGEPAPER